MNIIDEMAKDAVVDKYFLRLFQTLEKMYWDKLLSDEQISVNKLSPSEYVDILTFADILSLSSDAQHKNFALKIISCLKCFYENDPRYMYYSQGIMVRLGNFPGFTLLNNSENTELPFDIALEKSFKEIINKDPYSDKVFTDAQFQLLEELFDKNHFSFSGPTSFGKSFILTSYIKYLMMNNKRGLNIAFVVPTRALVSQTLKKFKSIFDGIDGYYLSSSPDIPALFCSNNAHYIFVFTPERLLHYFSADNNPSIEYVFVDEAQKILSEDTRAVVYYHAISLAERKSCKLFFSSPNISNVDVFLKLFNKTSDETETISESPVCQSRLFIDMLEKKNIIFSDLNEELIDADYDFPDEVYLTEEVVFAQTSTAKDTKASNGPYNGEFERFITRLETKLSDKRLKFITASKKKNGDDFVTEDFSEILKQFLGYIDKCNVTIIDLSAIPFEV